MNLTLGTLASLKTWLLPESERTGTDWDSTITAIGKSVAATLEKHCRRSFARVEGDTFECSADRSHVVLPRYPVEAVTKVEIRRSMTEGWVEITDAVQNLSATAGILYFGTELGSWTERLRITYTGGFWIDEADDGSVSDDRVWKQGSVDLDVNAESVDVVFASLFGSAPAVNPIVVPPADGMLIQAVPVSITEAGFTARLGFPIPAAGYKLQWTALNSTAATAPSEDMPEGATAVPSLLQVAWMQQCAHVFRQKDKLGSALAQNNGEVEAVNLELQPGVVQDVAKFRRLSLN